MKQTKIRFILFIALCLPFALDAQIVRMINSTQQNWSGGVAGRSGSNYTFVIEFRGYKREPVPDTLWIGREPFSIIMSDSANEQNGNTKRIYTRRSVKFEITVRTYHDDYAGHYSPIPENEPKTPPFHVPITYKGIALLSYKYNGSQHFYTINKIMKVFPVVNYP